MGNTALIKPSALVNLVGEQSCKGPAKYDGINEVLKMPNTYVHVYGKKETKPGRKMGHVTLIGDDKADLVRKAVHLKHVLKVIA